MLVPANPDTIGGRVAFFALSLSFLSYIYTMSLSLKLLRGTTLAQRPLGGLLRTPTSQWRRTYSTAPAADGTLPLQGIRVLDMTRVLAGVGISLTDYSVVY